MKKENEIINTLNGRFNDYVEKHEAHKQRVLKALDWWDEHFVAYPISGDETDKDVAFVRCLLNIDGVKCMCVKNDFTGVPLFVAEFHLRPLSMDGDIGNGAGMLKVVSF